MEKELNNPRRRFLQQSAAIGGGLVVGVPMPEAGAQTGTTTTAGVEMTAWVVVLPNNRVIIRYARSEMGQGSMTSASMLVAEELECDWSQVTIEYASANENVRRGRIWGDMGSVGSRTIRLSQEYLRKGGAQAREMLISAAAGKWGVPASECKAALGVITHTPSGRKLTFGDVAFAAAKLTPPENVKLKDAKDWTIAGKPIRRVDIPDTVMGRQRYGIDTQLPGMVYAAVAQCPVFGGKVKSYDASKVTGRRGVKQVLVVDNGGTVVVVADNWWRANEALKVLPVEWDVGGNGAVSSQSILQFLREGLDAPKAAIAKSTGNFQSTLATASKVLEAEYFTPYLSHAPMEPMGCTVLMKDGQVDVWCSTQSAEATLATAASTAGVAPENVEVHRTQLGGGFGRRGTNDFTRIAVQVAKTMQGTPVKTLWSREEDMQHDFYRPVALYRLKATLDASGNPVGWYTRIAAPSIFATLVKLPLKNGVDPSAVEGFSEFPYGVPNVQNEYAQRDTHVPVGFWRTVGWSQNPFARESFIDELAVAAGKDPYAYRRGLLMAVGKGEGMAHDEQHRREMEKEALHSRRALGVLDAVAKAAGWGKPLPPGVFRGIAVTEPYGAYAAAVIELSVSANKEIRIHRVVEGIDPGYIVNPDNVAAQLQGSVLFSLTAAMMGEITIKDGRVEQSNFNDYTVLRMPDMPKVEAVLAPSGGFWGGVGEPGQAPILPALANAIYAATGDRVRTMPLSKLGYKLVKA